MDQANKTMASTKPGGDKPSASTKTITPSGEIMNSLVVLATAAATHQLENFAGRLGDAMLKISETSHDSKQASLHYNAGNLLKKNAYPFQLVGSTQIENALQQEVQNLTTPHYLSKSEKTDEALTLVPYEVMDQKLLLASVGRPFEAANAGELTALNTRLALLLERTELSSAQNPFRPDVFLAAICKTWNEFNPDKETHSLALPLLAPEIFLDLAPILRGLNDELIACGILPELDDSYRIKKSNVNQEATRQEAPTETPIDTPLIQQLRQLFAPTRNGAASAAAQAPAGFQAASLQEQVLHVTAASNQLLGYLAGLQKTGLGHHAAAGLMAGPQSASLLANIKTQAPQGALSRVDENTIDLLTKVFDVVFRDQNIPTEIKALIGFLQVPVLKAALVDKEFFFKEEHPARRLIEVLTKSSAGWDRNKGQNDPLYQTIKRNVHRVQQDFDQQISVFSDVVSDLESFIKDEETSATEALAAPITEALKKEKLILASKAAKTDVALRVGTGEVVAFVETFLEKKWVSVLTLAYSVKDEKPEAVQSAVKTMDDLVWSVKPKATLEQRKELIAKLPGMLAMLNKWLNLIKLDDAERLQFFAELAECHASIVRAPLDISPQRQLEISIEVAKQAAERRRQRQATEQPEPVPDESAISVEKLERGTWFEFTQRDGASKKFKLAWVSPLRSLFIFSTRDKLESFSLSADDLAQTFRDKRAQPLWLGGLVGRALTEALESVGANDASIRTQTAA